MKADRMNVNSVDAVAGVANPYAEQFAESHTCCSRVGLHAEVVAASSCRQPWTMNVGPFSSKWLSPGAAGHRSLR
jgi:hypothetical protein